MLSGLHSKNLMLGIECCRIITRSDILFLQSMVYNCFCSKPMDGRDRRPSFVILYLEFFNYRRVGDVGMEQKVLFEAG